MTTHEPQHERPSIVGAPLAGTLSGGQVSLGEGGAPEAGKPSGRQETEAEAAQPPTPTSEGAIQEPGFRPLTRTERRNLWLQEYGDQDFALQMWARLVEQQDLEIEMMYFRRELLPTRQFGFQRRYPLYKMMLGARFSTPLGVICASRSRNIRPRGRPF